MAVRAMATGCLLVLLTGCAGKGGGENAEDARNTAGGGGAATGDSGGSPDRLLLRVEHVGGFVTPTMLASRLPLISVYGDGRVIDEGPTVMSYPPAALPNAQVRKIDPNDARVLADLARAAGVDGTKRDYGRPPIADATSVRFTVATGNGDAAVTEVYALNESVPSAQGLTGEQVRARASLRDLLAKLTDLPKTLGAAAVGETSPYRPTALAALATAWTRDKEASSDTRRRVWPGPALPGDATQAGVGCVEVTGSDTAKVLSAARDATTITPWTSRGKQWNVVLRPFLPDESTCADLRD